MADDNNEDILLLAYLQTKTACETKKDVRIGSSSRLLRLLHSINVHECLGFNALAA
jgi:hypothetical protein